jgi:hypothetical protein
MRRRDLLLGSIAAAAQAAPDAVASLENATLYTRAATGKNWFHPRACVVPGKPPVLLMTMQEITGSDVFHHVHWVESRDGGRAWSEPRPIPGMGRKRHPDGLEEGVCDTVPEYHAKTGAVIAMGHNVYYRDGKLTRPSEQRWPVYAIRTRAGEWLPPRRLEWSDPGATAMYTCGCSQRITLPGGDLIAPFSYGPMGRADRAVCSVRCSFDGRELKVKARGNELRLQAGRGLLEPSLATLDGRFYMTIRAEDGHGYVTESKDGLEWAPIRAWQWNDGAAPALEMSTTQQHWLAAPGALYLVYTRKAESNARVMRWRTPLWMARVDLATLRLVRTTERIVLPQRGDGGANGRDAWLSGNFHTTALGPKESIVTDGQTNPAREFSSDVLLARVRWR